MKPHHEEWRPVPEFDGCYEVSSLGKIRSIERTITRKDGKPLKVAGCILNTKANLRGYERFSMYLGDVRAWATVHSIVAKVFLDAPKGVIGCKRGQYVVNHKDGNKRNNAASNLEYITNLGNYTHAKRMGLLDHRGSANGRAKLSEDNVEEIIQLYGNGETQTALAKRFGVNQTTISRAVIGKGWKHIHNASGHALTSQP
jgi:hypothetical protein